MDRKKEIVVELIGKEFNGHRTEGLVDVESSKFESHYAILRKTWPQEFCEYLENAKQGRSKKDVMMLCMSREVRVKAGLGNPPNKYDNGLRHCTMF